MPDEKEKKIFLIVNLYAGKKVSQADVLMIEDLLKKRNYLVETYFTKCKRDATDVVLKRADEFDIIVCCGGDGTFHEILNGVIKLKKCIPVACFPMGTTNDLARSLNLPLTIEEAIDNISMKNVMYLDIGLFNKKEYFSYIASFGAFCEVSYGTSQKLKNFFGKIAYILEGFNSVRKIKPYYVKVECDDELIEGNFVFGAVTNSYSVAGLIQLKNEEIKFNDEKLELLLLREPKNIFELIKMLLDLRNNKFDDKFVILRHAEAIKLNINMNVPFTLDGEYAGDFSEVEVVCIGKKFKIIK